MALSLAAANLVDFAVAVARHPRPSWSDAMFVERVELPSGGALARVQVPTVALREYWGLPLTLVLPAAQAARLVPGRSCVRLGIPDNHRPDRPVTVLHVRTPRLPSLTRERAGARCLGRNVSAAPG